MVRVTRGSASPSGSSRRAVDALDRRFARFGREAERFLDAVGGPPASGRWVANPPMLGLMRSKWNPEILLTLDTTEGCGFEDLRRALSGITPRVLSARLLGLHRAGFVTRAILDLHPPRVRYSLTDRGRTLARISAPILLFLRHVQPSGRKGTSR